MYTILIDNPQSQLVKVLDENENENDFWIRRDKLVQSRKYNRDSEKINEFIPLAVDWNRIVTILKSGANFRMPISAPANTAYYVEDEIDSADLGLTVASNKKLFVSYDVVYSRNEELEFLLGKSGIQSRRFRNSNKLMLAYGARKNLFMKLIDSGFLPSKLGD